MAKLQMVLLPWRRVQSKEEAQYLITAGAVLIASMGLFELAVPLWLWADIPAQVQLFPSLPAFSKTVLFADPIIWLYAASSIFLRYRSAAVFSLLFFLLNLIEAAYSYWGSDDTIGTSDIIPMLKLIVECLGASAALRGTFQHGKCSFSAEAAPSAAGYKSSAQTSLLSVIRACPGVSKEETRSQEAAPLPPQTAELNARIFALRLAAIGVVIIGICVAIVSLVLAYQLIGWLRGADVQAGPSPDFVPYLYLKITPTVMILIGLGLAAGSLVFCVAFFPFFVVARRLWVLRFASIFLADASKDDEREFAANLTCTSNAAVERDCHLGVVSPNMVLDRIHNPERPFSGLRTLGLRYVVIGCVTRQTDGAFKVDFCIWDVVREISLWKQESDVKADDAPQFAVFLSHEICRHVRVYLEHPRVR